MQCSNHFSNKIPYHIGKAQLTRQSPFSTRQQVLALTELLDQMQLSLCVNIAKMRTDRLAGTSSSQSGFLVDFLIRGPYLPPHEPIVHGCDPAVSQSLNSNRKRLQDARSAQRGSPGVNCAVMGRF